MDTLWKVNSATAITCKKSEHMCFLSSLLLFSLCLSHYVLLLRVLLCVWCCVVCEGSGGGNQPQDGSICLSPQEAQCNERFARQYRYEPPRPSHGAFTIFPVPTIWSFSNHFPDHGIYTHTYKYTNTHMYIHRNGRHRGTEQRGKTSKDDVNGRVV